MTTTSDKLTLEESLAARGIPIPQPSAETKRWVRAVYESCREPGDPPLPPTENDAHKKNHQT